MNKEVLKRIKSGESIVSALVDVGLSSHRPFESMTDEILSINQRFASSVRDKGQLSEYLQEELTKAKKSYVQKVKKYYSELE